MTPSGDDGGFALRLERRQRVWLRVKDVGDVGDSVPTIPWSEGRAMYAARRSLICRVAPPNVKA